MTTSGTATYNETSGQIITQAMALVGAYQAGETISPEDSSYCLDILNGLTKNLAMTANLWVRSEVTHTLTPGTESYQVGSGLDVDTIRPLRLLYARRRNDSGVEIEVEIISRDDYMQLPVKDTQSPALKAYYDPQRENGVLYVWPTGSAGDTTLKLTFKRPLEDFTDQFTDPDFPQEWLLPLAYLLAVKISPAFLGGTIPQGLKMEAEQMLAELRSFDEEPVSISFSPRRR